MLIIKIFVNEKPIDEIHIQNIGKFDTLFGGYCPESPKRPDLHVYKIRKPEGINDIILHTRKHGHRILTAKAMQIIKHKKRKK